jgi:hypothetical protein
MRELHRADYLVGRQQICGSITTFRWATNLKTGIVACPIGSTTLIGAEGEQKQACFLQLCVGFELDPVLSLLELRQRARSS